MKAEKRTTEQLENLRKQQDLRRDSFEFHVSHVDEMKEEVRTGWRGTRHVKWGES